jgi:hypothetical protein
VVLLNRSAAPATRRLEWSALSLPPYLTLDLRDLWSGRELRKVTSGVSFDIPPTAAIMMHAIPSRPAGR